MGVPLASAQVQLSLLSWGPEQQRLLEAAEDLEVAVIAYSPLALGVLTGKYSVKEGVLPRGPRSKLFRLLIPQVQPLLRELEAVAKARRKTCSQACFVSRHLLICPVFVLHPIS
jgi:pyridoxine 4-dehydrogenase